MQIFLPESAKFIISRLESAGFKAYIVGGSVRDCVLGLTPDDFDVCTSAEPQEILSLFDKTVNTGIKHGTVAVIIDNKPFEVTTFRTDGAYKDFRHPDNVRFSKSLKDDLSRRDFTVNAMCYSEKEGLIDYFGGLDDLKNKTLKAVGKPDLRFKEDALRILRLFRFSSVLGFGIESETYNAAIENANLLKNISCERIRDELLKLSCGSNISAVMPLIDTGCISVLKHGDISRIPLLPEKPYLKFFAFLNLTSYDLETSLDFLKCSNRFKDYAIKLKNEVHTVCTTKADIKRMLRRLEDGIFDLFSYKSVILGEDTKSQERAVKEIFENNEPYKLSQLAVSGSDIKKKNISGKDVGEKLEFLLDCVIENPELNSKDKLLSLI